MLFVVSDEKPALMASLLNEFNARQKHLASINPDLYYFDLRGTLGGTQTSNQALKFDCIHPNDIGFQMIAARYAANLQLVTQER